MFKQESMTTGGKKNLTLVKPDGPLFVPPERTGLFHEDLTDTPPAGAFQSGLPEKAIELPGPLVQQAIARAIAGLSESQAFQAMDTSKMAKVNRLAHQVPKDAVHEDQVDAEKLLGDLESEGKLVKKGAEQTENLANATEASKLQAGELEQVELADPMEQAQAPSLESGPSNQQHPLAADGSGETEGEIEGLKPLESQATGPESGELGESVESSESIEAGASGSSGEAVHPADESAAATEPTEAVQPLDSVAPNAAAEPVEAMEAVEPTESSEPAEFGEPYTPTAETQALSDTPAVKDPEAEDLQQVSRSDLEQLHQEAFEAGRQAALEEMANAAPPPPSEEMLEAAREEAFQKGYEEGYIKAEAAVKDELQAEVELAAQNLNDFTSKLAEAARDTDTFYAPLLNLSMHLAEQLVRGELTLSSKAIQRLIETCLMEFEQEAAVPVVVRMHPDDLARIEQDDALLPKNMILRADLNLLIGSVKVQMNGALIEDLMQHRAQVLWQALMQGQEAGDLPDSFLRNVALVKEAFDEVASPDKAVDPFTFDEAITQESTSENPVLADATEKFKDSDSSEIPTEIYDDAKKGDSL